MKLASDFFTDDEQKKIEEAIVEAEKKTAAEIIPVVARCSGSYDRAEDILGLWFAAILAAVTWLVFSTFEQPGENTWGFYPVYLELPAIIVSIFIGFIIGAVVGTRITILRMLFIPKIQMLKMVTTRAREVFYDKRVHHTAGDTGILIYISLYERMAAVLADTTALESLGQKAVNESCSTLTDGLGKNACETLCKVIESLGENLKEKLPRKEDDVNEIADALVTID